MTNHNDKEAIIDVEFESEPTNANPSQQQPIIINVGAQSKELTEKKGDDTQLSPAEYEKWLTAKLEKEQMLINALKRIIAKNPRTIQLFKQKDKVSVHYTAPIALTILKLARAHLSTPTFFKEPIAEGSEEFIYTCIAYLDDGGSVIPVVGSAISTDKFYRTRYDPKSGKTYLLPLEEAKINHIKQKAVANMYSHALRVLLGLDGTLDELKEIGVDINKITGVAEFKGAKEVRTASTDTPSQEEPMTENQRRAVYALMNEIIKSGVPVSELEKKITAAGGYVKPKSKTEASKTIDVLNSLKQKGVNYDKSNK